MKKVAIHIGYHKSASTYLQRNLFPNLDANFVFLSGNKREILDIVQSSESFDPDIIKKWVYEKIKKQPKIYELTIISHEELSGHPHGYNKIDPLITASNLKKLWPNAKIIIVIRNQFDYLLSLYAFRVTVKGLEYRSFNKFFKNEEKSVLFEKLQYDRLIEYYISLFGKEKVLVIPMEMLKITPDNFIKTATNFLNIPSIFYKSEKKINESTKLLIVTNFWRFPNFIVHSLLNFLKLFSLYSDKPYSMYRLRYSYYFLKRRITPIINGLFNKCKKINAHSLPNYKNLHSKFSSSNLKIQKITPINLKNYGYPV